MGDPLWIDVSSTTESSIDSSSIAAPQIFQLPLWRHELDMVFLYTVFYVAVFSVGFFGNVFVVLAVAIHPSLRSTTDWLISSLATADLLIMLFCLPATLLNNILTEWQLGSFACKLSVWVNATTSCASIFTLVAVTADRYMAICHTLKYTQWDTKYTLYIIAGIWIVSGSMASPQIYNYDMVKFNYFTEDNRLARVWLCSSTSDERIQFLVVNLLLGFIAPFILIFVFYTMIFIRVSNHRSLAVDAHIRDERVKLRVAHMMLTVIAFFALCWVPLYSIYFYFLFISDGDSEFMRVASTILRPFFQWLSLLSSSLNPVIYIAYSLKYRRAFHRLLLLPCRNRYERVRTLTRTTLRLGSSPQTIKKRPPNYLSTTLPTEQTTLTRASNRSLNNFRSPSGSPSLADGRESRESDFRFSSCKKITQF